MERRCKCRPTARKLTYVAKAVNLGAFRWLWIRCELAGS